MAIKQVVIRVTTTGSAGVATGNTDTDVPIVGEILGVYFNFNASAASTQDTTLKTKGDSVPTFDIVKSTNVNTDTYFAPRAKPVDSANSAITNAHTPFVVADKLNLDVAQGDALTDAVVAHVWYRE